MIKTSVGFWMLSALGVSGGGLAFLMPIFGQVINLDGSSQTYTETALAGIIVAAASLVIGVINAIVFGLKTHSEQRRLDREADFQRQGYLKRIVELEAALKETNRVAFTSNKMAENVAKEVSNLGNRMTVSESKTRKLSQKVTENQPTSEDHL